MNEQKINYTEMVRVLAKPGDDILDSLNSRDCHLLHMVVGVSGEAGELLDAVKRAVIYRKQIDIENVREEVGDIMFYLTGLCDSLDITVDQCIDDNIKKLSVRYRGMKYSDRAAIAREDKE